MILEPVIIECPRCHLQSLHYTVMSGTIYSSDTYTDGKMDNITGAYATNPFLVRCRNCHGFYFFGEATKEGEQKAGHEPLEDLRYEEYYLKVSDYKECINNLVFNDINNEKSVRVLYWQAINDLIRFDSFYGSRGTWYFNIINILIKPFKSWKKLHQNYRKYLSWKKEKDQNLEKILSLLDPDQSEDDSYMVVEIYRELGLFRKARRVLKNIPGRGSRKFITFQRKLLFRRDRFVRKFPA